MSAELTAERLTEIEKAAQCDEFCARREHKIPIEPSELLALIEMARRAGEWKAKAESEAAKRWQIEANLAAAQKDRDRWAKQLAECQDAARKTEE